MKQVVVPDPKIVDVKAAEAKDGTRDLTIPVNTSKKRFVDAKVTISTDVPGEETLTIPVTAMVE